MITSQSRRFVRRHCAFFLRSPTEWCFGSGSSFTACATSTTKTTKRTGTSKRSHRLLSSNEGSESPGCFGIESYAVRCRFDDENDNPKESLSPSTVLSHAGLPISNSNGSSAEESNRRNTPLSPPIHLATTYSRPASGNYDDAPDGRGQIYGRTDNATREILEETVGRLELMPYRGMEKKIMKTVDTSFAVNKESAKGNETETVAFSSGMASIPTLLLSHPTPTEVLLPEDCYHGVPTLIHTVLKHHGIRFRSVNMTDHDSIETALRQAIDRRESEGGSIIVWSESPSNPLLSVADVPNICQLVDKIRCELSSLSDDPKTILSTVVDSTLFPPPLSTPLLFGADFVVHSGTKYLGGHSDALLGVVTASPFTSIGRELGPRIRQVQQVIGCQASPFDSWLVLRGMRTLHVRVERQCRTALKVAKYLSELDTTIVTKVHYPGLHFHPDHSLALTLMPDGLYGGVLSFEVANAGVALAVAGAVRVIERGTSLGGTETLIEHRASIEPAGRVTSPPGLLRMSIGLEDHDDIIDDLDRALQVADQVVAN